MHKIDSIVSTTNTDVALPIVLDLYQKYKLQDSTSTYFRKLSWQYVFILEKSELNEKAVELANQLLDRKFDDDEFNAHVLILLVRLQEKLYNAELCHQRLEESRNLAQHCGNDSLWVAWNVRKSSYHRTMEELYGDSAIFYAENAYRLAQDIPNSTIKGVATFLYAVTLKDLDKRIPFYQEALDIFLDVNDHFHASLQHLNIARSEQLLGNEEGYVKHMNLVKKMTDEYPFWDALVTYYAYQMRYFREKNQFDSALVMADSLLIFTERGYSTRDRMKLMAKDFDFSTRRLKKQLNETQELAELKEEQRRTMAYTLLIIVGLSIIILILAWDQFQKKKQIRLDNEVILQQNIELGQAIEKNKLLMREMNHRLKNNLSTLSGLLEIQANKTVNKVVENELNKSIHRINLISEVYKSILEEEENYRVLVVPILQRLIEAQTLLFGKSASIVDAQLDKLYLRSEETIAFALIVNELLTNAFKYGDLNLGSVQMELKLIPGQATFSISNPGQGLAENYKISDAKSSGLYIVNLLVKQLGGNLKWYQQGERFNLHFTIKLPDEDSDIDR
ncbi:sensor histidine kinase [bacterium SCSIO 12741]|nr:sensor histidine kinase [bacterium SCSIO 12741]